MTEATAEERQEALSIRYVDAARVVLLASGRYAVFTMASGQIIATVEGGELGPAVAEACASSRAAWTRAKEEELAEQRRDPVVLPGNFADLGL